MTLVDKICTELEIHSEIEEKHLYPTVRRAIEEARGLVDHSLDEHEEVASLIEEIRAMNIDDESLDATMEELINAVQEHVEEEETELFPEMKSALNRETLMNLGEQLARTKRQLKGSMKAA
jgi:hemerythrin-like domain-containing protein